MPARTYAVIQVTGTSGESSDAAIRNAVARASRTLRNVDWFEVIKTRGQIEKGRVQSFQVTLKVGFRVLEPLPGEPDFLLPAIEE